VELSASVNNIYSQDAFATPFFIENHFHIFFGFSTIFILLSKFLAIQTVLSLLQSLTTIISYFSFFSLKKSITFFKVFVILFSSL
jgi:hypothetical protein